MNWLTIAMTKPRQIKAPGGRMKTRMLAVSGRMRSEKMVPLPNNSRMQPKMVRAKVKPNPIPIPSKSDARGEFLAAKASARPRIIQLTTISGIKRPSDLSTSGR